jgi:hypothetical protein
MIREMSPIEVAAMDVAHDREFSRTYGIHDDLPENVHPGKWIANTVAFGLLVLGLIWWAVS